MGHADNPLFGEEDEGEGAIEEGIRMGQLAVHAADDHATDEEGQARPRTARIRRRVERKRARAGRTGDEAPVDATPARGNPSLAATPWVQEYSRTHARVYWKHGQTGASVWEVPAGVVEVEMRESPAGEGKRWTRSQFIAHYGGGTEWDAAGGEAAETRRADDSVMPLAEEPTLPAGWAMRHSEGVPYYVNAVTHETTWTRPLGNTSPPTDAMRRASDGGMYTCAQFVAHYGDDVKWRAAT